VWFGIRSVGSLTPGFKLRYFLLDEGKGELMEFGVDDGGDGPSTDGAGGGSRLTCFDPTLCTLGTHGVSTGLDGCGLVALLEANGASHDSFVGV